MQKKYIIIALGTIILLIPILLLTFSPKSPSQSTALQNDSAGSASNTIAEVTGGGSSQRESFPTVIPSPTEGKLSPEVVTQRFYMQHFQSDPNPLSDGRYKNNKYISTEFKEVIGDLYNGGDTTVFCMENRRNNVVFGKTQSVYNKSNGYLSQVIITESSPNGRDLYRVLLKEENGKWLIFDSNCIY